MSAWEVLGVAQTATAEQIRAAHRRLIRRFHPDRAPAGMRQQYEERAKAINAAKDQMLRSGPRRTRQASERPTARVEPQPAETPRTRPDRPTHARQTAATPPAAPPSPARPVSAAAPVARRPTAPPTSSRDGAFPVLVAVVVLYFALLTFAVIGWLVTTLLPAVTSVLTR